MTLSELREKRTKLWDQAKNYLDAHTDDGLIADEHAAVYDKMEAEIVGLGKQIERLERRHDLDDAMGAPTSKPLYSTPGAANNRGSGEYTRAFWNAIRGRGVTNVLSEGIDTSGGFLVPEEFSSELIEALKDQNIFRQICRIVSTSREKLKVPVATASGTATWVEENAVIPESDSAFGQVILNAYKLGTLMRASTELIEDSAFNIQSYIAQEFARRIGACEEEAFATGDGTGKPTGIFAATGGAQIGVTAANVNLTFDNIIDLYHSLRSPYRAKSVFVTNDSTLKTLRKLKSADGAYIWQPSVKDGYPDTVLGKHIYTSPFVPELATGNCPVAFGDFSYYWIVDRRDTRFKVLNEKYAEQDQIGFFATERVDGKLILPEAVRLLQIAAGITGS